MKWVEGNVGEDRCNRENMGKTKYSRRKPGGKEMEEMEVGNGGDVECRRWGYPKKAVEEWEGGNVFWK